MWDLATVIRVYLRASVFIVGRHRSANLVLPGEDVSNIHGKIYAVSERSMLGEPSMLVFPSFD